MATPIWKDRYVTLPAVSGGTLWRIRYQTDQTVFTGRAYPKPGASLPSVRINDICAEYLGHRFPLEGADKVNGPFYTDAWDGSAWVNKDYVLFCRDWTYQRTAVDETDADAYTNPITLFLHKDGYLPVFSPGGTGTATLKLIPPDSGDFNGDYNQDFLDGVPQTVVLNWESQPGDWYMLDLSDYEGLYEVIANGQTYKIANQCGGFVLYYLNALGGWDVLHVGGRAIRSEDYTRHVREVVYDNGSALARGKDNYVTEVAPRWRLTVGPLPSEDAARIGELTGSVSVWLHDIVTGVVRPVVLTSSTEEIKDRRGSLSVYEIEAALAQDRLRR